MGNKKGFALIETLITTVVLATALVSLYVLFNNMMVKEKRRLYYDDPIFVVRSEYVFDMFFETLKSSSNHPEYSGNYPENYVDFGEVLSEGSIDDGTYKELYIKSFSCDNDAFKDKDSCRLFFNQLQLYRIYVSRYDLSYIETCKNSNSYDCINYSMLSTQAKQYLRSLPYVPNSEGFYIIFEYNASGTNEVCQHEGCMHQFASVKYGGSNTVINLK